jgi:hypothetical protein
MSAAVKVKHVPGTEPTKYVVETEGVVTTLPASWRETYDAAYWQARMRDLIVDAIPGPVTVEVLAAEAWADFNHDCD